MRLVSLLLIILIGLTTLGQFGRFGLGSNVFVYFNDLLIPAILLTWFTYKTFTKSFSWYRLLGLMTLFLLWALIGLIHAKLLFANVDVLISSLYLIRLVFYLGIYMVAKDAVKFDGTKILVTLITTSVVVSMLGFIQLVVVPDFSQMAATEGWDPHQFRLLSTFYDPNFVGGFLALALGLIMSAYLKYPNRRILLSAAAVINSVAIILTFSRSAYLAAAVVVVLVALLKWRKLLLLLPVVVLVTLIALPRTFDRLTEGIDPGTSGYLRVVAWQHSLIIAQDNLVYGVGYNAYRYAQENYQFIGDTQAIGGNSGAGTDSSLLLLLATTGIPGLILWIALATQAWRIGWRAYRRNSVWGLPVVVGIPALLVHSVFLNSLFYPWIMLYLWVMIGGADAAAD